VGFEPTSPRVETLSDNLLLAAHIFVCCRAITAKRQCERRSQWVLALYQLSYPHHDLGVGVDSNHRPLEPQSITQLQRLTSATRHALKHMASQTQTLRVSTAVSMRWQSARTCPSLARGFSAERLYQTTM
jgi:hypothetical protein